MSLFNIRKTVVGLAIGLTIMIAGSSEASAQSRRQIERERQRIENEQRRVNRQRQDGRYNRIVTRANNADFDQGYHQGIIAGQFDRRKNKYNQSNVYRGTGSAPNGGDPTSTDYIYRQGYLQGYNDGYYGGGRY